MSALYYVEIGASILVYTGVFFICRALRKRNGGIDRKLRRAIACMWAVSILGLLFGVIMLESGYIAGAILIFVALCACVLLIADSARKEIGK